MTNRARTVPSVATRASSDSSHSAVSAASASGSWWRKASKVMRNEDIHQAASDRAICGVLSTNLWYCLDKCSRIGEPCLLVNPLSAVNRRVSRIRHMTLERGDSGTTEMIRGPRYHGDDIRINRRASGHAARSGGDETR